MMKQRTNKAEHEMRRSSSKFQRQETWPQRKELADTLSSEATKQFASVTNSVLKEEFGELCDIKIKERWWYFKICMNKKGIPEKSVPQIEITITKDFKFNIHLNDYEDFEWYYFYGEKLTTKELMSEVENFKEFLAGKKELENSKLEKIDYSTQEAI